MKKNYALRVGSLLLALTLITSCFVGGTFAKYTTAGEGTDSARVAKWGVEASVTGDTFRTQYDRDDVASGIDITVKSSNADKVIAPGTKGDFAGIKLSGTPEVAVEVQRTAIVDLNGWEIPKGDGTKEFYCPLVFHINGVDVKQDTTNNTETKLEEAIKTEIEKANGKYDSNKDLSTVNEMGGTYSWSWDFDENGAGTNDAKDTALGNAGTLPNVSVTVGVTVTQID